MPVKMNSAIQFKQMLMDRLADKGVEKENITGLIRSIKICLLGNPTMNHLQLDKELEQLGWYDIDMDYHTLQIAVTYFESKAL